MNDKILLLGATGYTANLVAQELINQKIPFTFSGRDFEKLQALSDKWDRPFIVMDLQKAQDLKKIPTNVEYILNCAGPFNLFAPLLLKYISEKSIKHFDISGEQSFVYTSYHENLNTKSTLIHACAFESFIADALASRMGLQGKSLKDLSSFYHFSRPKTSPGTKLSMQLVHHFQTYFFEDSSWKKETSKDKITSIRFSTLNPKVDTGYFVPYPEIVFFAKNYQTESSGSYFLIPRDAVMAFQISSPNHTLEQILSKHQLAHRPGPSDSDRLRDQFLVGIRAQFHDGTEQLAFVEGFDTYQITAALLVESLKSVQNQNTCLAGVYAPSQIVDSMKILNSLKDRFQLRFG